MDRLRYQIGDGAQTTVSMTSSTKTITFAPPYGLTSLRFWLLDKAGNVSNEVTHELKIMSPRVQHAWLFNDGSGTDVADMARPVSRPMDVAVGSGTWSSGYRADTITNDPNDTALHFDGTGGGATTTSPAVFTRDSYTVTARVKLDQMEGGTFVAVSQDGVQNSAFKLGYNTTLDSWAAWFHPTDTAGGSWVRLDSGLEPIDEGNEELPPFPDGEPDWQHLALVHDAAADQVRLLVDGTIVATMDTTDILDWDSTGPLRIGRGQTDGSPMGTASGKVDDVFIFDAALTEAQIRRVALAIEDELQVEPIRDELLAAGQVARWSLNDGQGQLAVDSTGNGHDLTVSEAASWVAGIDGSALRFDDDLNAFAQTDDPVFDTTASHTVTSWVRLTGSSTLTAGVASQSGTLPDGTAASGMLLSYSNSFDAWRFGKRRIDNGDFNTVRSFDPPQRDEWVHIAGVFEVRDLSTCLPATRITDCGEYRLYVDGVLQEIRTATEPWAADGPFRLGAYMRNGEFKYPFRGDIDEVRVFNRVLSSAEIAYLAWEELS
ncbi:MAG TPA: LamG domain-containing protein [Jiangellaceae bacterium]